MDNTANLRNRRDHLAARPFRSGGGRVKQGVMVKRPQPKPGLPSEQDILDFIASAPGAIGKREIARAFQLRGADKIGLKALLKQMAEDGKLARRQRKIADASRLPPVTVIEMVGVDKDGEAYGEPIEWDERS